MLPRYVGARFPLCLDPDFHGRRIRGDSCFFIGFCLFKSRPPWWIILFFALLIGVFGYAGVGMISIGIDALTERAARVCVEEKDSIEDPLWPTAPATPSPDDL